MQSAVKLAVFATHPVQYTVPWFQALARQRGCELKVYYGMVPDAQQQGHGFGVNFEWDSPLFEGYQWEVLANRRASPGLDGFFRLTTADHLKGCGRRLGRVLAVTKDILVEIQDDLFVVCHENSQPRRSLAAHVHVPTGTAGFFYTPIRNRSFQLKRLDFGPLSPIETFSELQISPAIAEV